MSRINESRCTELLSLCNEINPGDKVRIWFHTLEASVGIKKKKDLNSFFFKFPITVVVEKIGLSTTANSCIIDLNDLSLNQTQIIKIKQLLTNGIIGLMKKLKFTKRETEHFYKKMDKILETAFASEEEALVSEGSFSDEESNFF